MENSTPAQKAEQSLRNYSIWMNFCLGAVFGTFVGMIVTGQGVFSATVGLVALIAYYVLTFFSSRMLKRSVTLVARPLETKDTHV